jgi:WD40 repeat protein
LADRFARLGIPDACSAIIRSRDNPGSVRTEACCDYSLARSSQVQADQQRKQAEIEAVAAQKSEEKARKTSALADLELSSLYLNRAKPEWAEALAHLARGLRTDPKNALLRESSVLVLTTGQWSFLCAHPLRHDDWVWTANFSPDGTRIVTASEDKTARIWDAQTGKPITHPLHHDAGVVAASFSPDGTRIVTASEDKTARIWDAQTGQPIGQPLYHGSGITKATFSPDGTRIVTASADSTARIWDAQTGQPIGEPLRHGAAVWSASFSPDGAHIVTASYDRTARIWDAQTGQPIGEPLQALSRTIR